MSACPSCGEENPERARFCLSCGRPISAEGAGERAAETRRRVTVLFTDVVGSTPLGERLDPEALREVMQRYFDAMRVAIERHEGTVEKFIGDAVMAVFGIPQIHEDDALRAVRAALDMQAALAILNRDLRARWGIELVIRTGINTGEVVAGDATARQSLATGDVVNTAARLEQVAGTNEILVGPDTYRLVRHAVLGEQAPAVQLKGKAEPMSPWRVLATASLSDGGRRFDSPLVGRDRQLHLLQDAASRSREERAPQLVTILGLAGVGKSRLVHEFLQGQRGEGATVIRGRCLSYGDAITYWPLAEALRTAAGITDDDPPETAVPRLRALAGDVPRADVIAQRVGAAIGLGEGAIQTESQETFWAVRRLFEAMAMRSPLIVVFDDIHWGTSTFLDLIEHVVDWARDAPILLITLARPELLEVRQSWGGGKLNATTLLLEPLDDAAVRAILANLVGGAELPDQLIAKISAAAEGNPLFVEELVSMLADDGVLVDAQGGFQVARTPDEIPVPATIELLLAARLDRLPTPERAALGRGAVIGRQFGASEVGELTPAADRPELLDRLLGLVRKELVRQEEHQALEADDIAEDLRFRFRHQLVRDAAYEALPKHERARLHELFAGWLERTRAGHVDPLHEVIGHHLAEAARLSGEVGGDAPATRSLATRAAGHLEAASRRARVVGDSTAVTSLLERAVALRDPQDEERLRDLPLLAEALAEVGRLEEARAAIDTVLQSHGAPEDARAAALEVAFPLLQLGMSGAEVGARVEEALAIRRRLGEPAGLARALAAMSQVSSFLGRLREARELADEGLKEAQRAGDLGLRTRLGAARWGLNYLMSRDLDADVAREQIDSSIRFAREHGLLELEAGATMGRSMLASMSGDRQRAAELRKRSIEMWNELGRAMIAAVGDPFAPVEASWAGDVEREVTELRARVAGLQRLGERGVLSTTAADLAHALLDMDQTEEAEEACRIAAQTGASDDVVTQVALLAARARILGRQGDLDAARAMAHQAVELAEASEYAQLHARAHLAMGEILLRAGMRGEAAEEWRRVLGDEERRGNRLFAGRLRHELSEIEAGREPRPIPPTS